MRYWWMPSLASWSRAKTLALIGWSRTSNGYNRYYYRSRCQAIGGRSYYVSVSRDITPAYINFGTYVDIQ